MVGEDADDLLLAHGDHRGVAVDGVGFVGYVGGAVVDGLVADLVHGGDEAVQGRGGGVEGGPERFAVVGDVAAVELLFLPVVDFFFLC